MRRILRDVLRVEADGIAGAENEVDHLVRLVLALLLKRRRAVGERVVNGRERQHIEQLLALIRQHNPSVPKRRQLLDGRHYSAPVTPATRRRIAVSRLPHCRSGACNLPLTVARLNNNTQLVLVGLLI